MSKTMKINSINNRQNSEKAWADDANVYGDIDSSWNIAIGNGKRLSRRWRRKGGLLFTVIAGREHTIYNEKYDAALLKAGYKCHSLY